MKNYQEYLKCKYESFELTSPDEMLDCFSPQYIDLVLIKDHKTKPIRQRKNKVTTQDDLWSDVSQDSDTECVTLSEALDVEDQKKKIVWIEGDPGMGKTTLAINICKCWAKGELLQSYDAVILLTLRDPEIQEAKTISDLLLTPDEELRDNVFKEVVKNHGARICFIFEGYDELPSAMEDSPVFTKVMEKLPKCMLVYTSRPCFFFSLHTHVSQTIKINGFTDKSVDEYISKAFENEADGKKMALELQSQVHSNPELKKILLVPINVAIICLIFFHYMKLPNTLTELYTLLCLRLLLRHIIKHTPKGVAKVKQLNSLNDLPEEISKEFTQLCYIGYKGIADKKIIFSSEDLCELEIVEDKLSGLGLLLIAPSTSVFGIKKSYNFLHLTLQEFCAAWHFSKLSYEEQIKRFDSYLNSKAEHKAYSDGINSDIFWKFYSGITELKEIDIENSILPCELPNTQFIKQKLFALIELLYEAGNKSLCQIIGDNLYGVLDSRYSLSDSYNVQSLGYFLRYYKGELAYLKFGFSINNKIFETIVKSLEERHLTLNVDNDLTLELSLLSISSTQSFCAFANLLAVCQYPVVQLSIQHYQNKHLQFLPPILNNSKTLEILEIECSDLGYEGADCLCNCKDLHLRYLGLSRCELGPTGADKIGEMLSHNSSIISIDLSFNSIDDSGIEKLVDHLKSNNTLQFLNLSRNLITAFGALHLKEIINNLCDIKLSYNPLGHVGYYLILEAITVPLQHIELCGRDASYCYKSFAAILDKVKSISFTAPDDCEDCKVIGKSLVNANILEHLEISGISNLNQCEILNSIGQNNNIKELHISYKFFTHECAEGLAKFIRKNKSLISLTLRSKKLSPEGLLLFSDSLTENTSITDANVISDDFYDRLWPNIVLEFLYHLKQTDMLKRISLWIMLRPPFGWQYRDFHQDLEKCIQQINYARKIKGINPLEVDIDGYLY